MTSPELMRKYADIIAEAEQIDELVRAGFVYRRGPNDSDPDLIDRPRNQHERFALAQAVKQTRKYNRDMRDYNAQADGYSDKQRAKDNAQARGTMSSQVDPEFHQTNPGGEYNYNDEPMGIPVKRRNGVHDTGVFKVGDKNPARSAAIGTGGGSEWSDKTSSEDGKIGFNPPKRPGRWAHQAKNIEDF